jgi:PIN domain nuclease of toxin-antitoxin system
MNVLLDTHTAIWFLNGDSELSENAKANILSRKNNVYISIASVWELAIKLRIKKLNFRGGTKGFVNLLEDNGIEIIPIGIKHLFELDCLPTHHRDPFDRIIISTAISEKMVLLTRDENVQKYNVKYKW